MSKNKLTLKNDVVFKELFSKKGNEIFLQDFLSDLLNLNIEKIEIQKDTTLSKDIITEKYGILDIKATLNDTKIVNIEMQITNYSNMAERALYYSSKLISSQLKTGDDYIKLKPVIVICILNFKLFPFKEYITDTVTVSSKHPDYEIIKHQKFYFIELPKFRKNKKDLNKKTSQWLTFIDGNDKKGVEDAMSRNCVIKKAKEEFDYLTGNERLNRLAELREKALKDNTSLYNYGIRTGLDQGIKQGIKQGIEQGVVQERKRTIKLLVDQNFSNEMIMKITNLSMEEIEKLK